MPLLVHYRILVIEDDPRMVELLRVGLQERGHDVVTAMTVASGECLLHEEQFDVIVLDIGLPDGSGYGIAERLRERQRGPAIMMLTALNKEDNVVCGLDAGADDYLTKPFSFPELVARIASAVRRSRIATEDVLCFGPFKLDVRQRMLFNRREQIWLTPSEYLLLRALALYQGEVIERRRLMQAVWGTTTVSHGALDTLVNTLREKLEEDNPRMIATVRGMGYSLTEPGGIENSTHGKDGRHMS